MNKYPIVFSSIFSRKATRKYVIYSVVFGKEKNVLQILPGVNRFSLYVRKKVRHVTNCLKMLSYFSIRKNGFRFPFRLSAEGNWKIYWKFKFIRHVNLFVSEGIRTLS